MVIVKWKSHRSFSIALLCRLAHRWKSKSMQCSTGSWIVGCNEEVNGFFLMIFNGGPAAWWYYLLCLVHIKNAGLLLLLDYRLLIHIWKPAYTHISRECAPNSEGYRMIESKSYCTPKIHMRTCIRIVVDRLGSLHSSFGWYSKQPNNNCAPLHNMYAESERRINSFRR